MLLKYKIKASNFDKFKICTLLFLPTILIQIKKTSDENKEKNQLGNF